MNGEPEMKLRDMKKKKEAERMINKLQSKAKEKRKIIKIVKYGYLMKQSPRDRYQYRDGKTKNKEEKYPNFRGRDGETEISRPRWQES